MECCFLEWDKLQRTKVMKLGKLATMETGLNFLQNEYRLYSVQSLSNKYLINSQNSKIQEEDSTIPNLRLLYIDLIMHDTMLANAEKIGDLNNPTSQRLKQKKMIIYSLIKEREKGGEKVVPDEKVSITVESSKGDDGLICTHVLEWIPQEHREEFQKTIYTAQKKYRNDPEMLLKVFRACVKKGAVLNLKSLEAYRNFVGMCECFLLHMDS
jgi:hypothetical protein